MALFDWSTHLSFLMQPQCRGEIQIKMVVVVVVYTLFC